jgi:hypothetical protein
MPLILAADPSSSRASGIARGWQGAVREIKNIIVLMNLDAAGIRLRRRGLG